MKFFALLIISLAITCVSAQDITISSLDLVNLKNEIQLLKDSVIRLNGIVGEKDSLIKIENNRYNELISQKDSIQSAMDVIKVDNEEKKALIEKLQEDVKNYNSQMQTLQEIADRNAAKLANGRLYFKYSEKLVSSSIKELQELKTEQVKNNFMQALILLQGYKKYSEDVKNTLIALQSIDRNEWKSKHRIPEYKEDCMAKLKQSVYYQNVYLKKSASSWSIPYLDNLIDGAKAIISKHNPVESEFANFTPLIEML